MPGKSWSGPLPPLTEAEEAIAGSLRRDVRELGGAIGNRNDAAPEALFRAAHWVEERLRESGCPVHRQTFDGGGMTCWNVEAERPGSGTSAEIVIVGAHYDSARDCPGANDNATGVGALLSLASALGKENLSRTLRFVAFANEEPPHFQTRTMGSLAYARRCRERQERVVAMLSLESIGCYSDRPGTQAYPPPLGLLYPSTGNFIAFVGNVRSRALVKRTIRLFREHAKFPSEGAAVPGIFPGVGWSDHWSFWEEGYPGVMVTDTAPFRYAEYHTPQDTPEKIDYERCARVVAGLLPVIRGLAEGP
jgi:Zn-dependent M28 family amino/carboxypeptidase